MKTLVLVFAMLIATAGFAQSSPSRSSSDHAKADPNETMCRIINQTGSRLNRSRICMTRAEWIEWQRELRENSERAQMRRVQDR